MLLLVVLGRGPALFVGVKVLSITCKLDLSHNFLSFSDGFRCFFPLWPSDNHTNSCGTIITFCRIITCVFQI